MSTTSTVGRRRQRRFASAVAVTAMLGGLCVGLAARPAEAAGITHVRTINNTDYVSAGVSGVGASGTGSISVTGVSGPVTKALLYWHGINNSSPNAVYGSASPTFNGTPVTGASRGDAGNNCWGDGSSRTYVADVTALVAGNGIYNLAGLSSTPGDNANGASMVVLYDDGNAANNRDVVLFEGNDSDFPQGYPGDDEGWHASLPNINLPAGGTAALQLHVADGQDFGQPDDGAIDVSGPGGTVTIPDLPTIGRWDGTTLPSAGDSRASNGQLYDIESFDITGALATGNNTVHIDHDGVNDCLGLVVALVALPVGSAPPPPPSCSINDVSLTEGNTGTKQFAFTLSRSSGVGTTSVDYSTSSLTAFDGSDFQGVSGTVHFAVNDLSETVSVPVIGDTVDEGDELFLVNLSNASGCVLVDPNGFGTIVNDDSAAPPAQCGTAGTNRISIGDAQMVEGDSGAGRTLKLPVTLSNPSASEVDVTYTIDDGAATSPSDFTNKVGVPKVLKFKPAANGVMATTKFVVVKVVPDTANEGDEDLTVTLTNPTGGYGLGRQVGTGTILDDDGGAPTQAVAITGSSLCEGDTSVKGNQAVYQVTLRSPAAADTALTVQVSPGSATSGVDYKAVPKPKKLKIKAGKVQAQVIVTVLPDGSQELDEDVQASLTSSPVPVLLSPATGLILDDDAGGVIIAT